LSTYAELIKTLIDSRIEKVNTLAIGKITSIDLNTWRANVLLKSKIQDATIELRNVPIAVQGFGAGSIHIAPAVNDVVVVGFSKYEMQTQLGDKDLCDVNERILHNLNHAIILSGVHTEVDSIPEVAADEILIKHKSGSYLKFLADGSIELKTAKFRVKKLS
jgi:hypothetical protein